jgi:predicted transcriptional regulator
MTDSMSAMLRSDMQCEGLLACFHDLTGLDEEIFRVLHEHQRPLTVDEIADAVERERSTAYRAVQRLLDAGIVEQSQVNYEQGGYHHVYRPRDAEATAREMQRTLNDWYAKMGLLIDEFARTYADEPRSAASAER